MKTLEVVKFLQATGLQGIEAFKKLRETFAIDYKTKGNLIVLNYNQIKSPKTHAITKECRSLVLDLHTFEVISRAYDRFFNLGEGLENHDIDYSQSYGLEKADGSLVVFFYNPHEHQWIMRTRTAFGDDVTLSFPHMSFKDLIYSDVNVTDELIQELFKSTGTDLSFIFEYIGFHIQHTTKYSKNELVLIGVRNNITGEYWGYDALLKWVEQVNVTYPTVNMRVCKVFKFNSLEQVIEALTSLPRGEEGFVMWDTSTNMRFKIKSPSYLAQAKLIDKGEFVPRRIVVSILLGDMDEIITYNPDYAEHFKPYKEKVDALLEEMNVLWEKVKYISDKKEFAMQVKSSKLNGLFFAALRDGNTPHEQLQKLLATDAERIAESFV